MLEGGCIALLVVKCGECINGWGEGYGEVGICSWVLAMRVVGGRLGEGGLGEGRL